MQLSTPLVYTSKVAPVVLPPPLSELDPPAGLAVTIAGWGDTVVSTLQIHNRKLFLYDILRFKRDRCIDTKYFL